MMDLIFVLASLALLTVGLLVPGMLTRRVRNLRRHEEAANLFFDKIDPLLSDDDTPESLVRFADFMICEIGDRLAIRRLLVSLFGRGNGNHEATESEEKDVAEWRAFFAKRPELEKAFGVAVGAAMTAIIMNAPGWRGVVARFWLEGLVRRVNYARAAARMKSHSDRDHHHHNGHLPQAA